MTTNAYGLDDKLNTSGGAMSGTLTLKGTPALIIPSGTNACAGTAVLNGTTAVTVATTVVDTLSQIMLTTQIPSGTVGTPYIFSKTNGVGFTIKSTSGSDASTVAWFIIEL